MRESRIEEIWWYAGGLRGFFFTRSLVHLLRLKGIVEKKITILRCQFGP